MIVNDLCALEQLSCNYLSDSLRGEDVDAVVISGLMSDVLTFEAEALLLVSGLCTDQVLRTADMVGAPVIIISSGKKITDSMIAIAEESDIALFSTDLRNFELANLLAQKHPELLEEIKK